MHPYAPDRPTRMIRRRRRTMVGVLALGLGVAALVAGCGSDASPSAATTTGAVVSTTSAAADPGAVVKDILGTEVDPPGAGGRTLTLIRYTIPPGAKLVPHIHPGVQLASITSGRLTYTVVKGSAIVRRSGAKADERIAAGTTTHLDTGDTVTELDGMVHFGANDTKDPVIIEATLLTIDGEDLAVPVTTVGG